MKILGFEPIPEWYRLGWDAEHRALRLEMSQDVIPLVAADLVRPRGGGLPLVDPGNRIGNETAGFDFVGRKGENQQYLFELPKCYEERACGCRGRRRLCSECDGSGKRRKFDWDKGKQTAIAMSEVLQALSLCEADSKAAEEQLLAPTTYVGEGMHGFPLFGRIALSLGEWMRRRGAVNMPEIADAMRAATGQMLGESELNECRAFLTDGVFNFAVPGS